MARSRGRPHLRVGGSRRESSWSEGPGDSTPGSITASGTAILGLGAVAVEDGLTIVRTRGLLTLVGNVFTTVGDAMVGAFGLCIVSENAFGVGVTAVPAPLTDVGWNGWFYHTFVGVSRGTADFANGSGFQRIVVDSKAMRKIKRTDVVIAVIELVETGAADVDVFFDSRLLSKLS